MAYFDPTRSTQLGKFIVTCVIGGTCYAAGASAPSMSCQICDPTGAGGRTNFTLKANTCFIANVCYGSGATNGATTCQVCNPSATTSNWSIKSSTCFINNSCYNSGAPNPANTCQQCLPCDAPVPTGAVCGTAPQQAASRTQFTNSPVSRQCATADTCHNTGLCSGSGTCNWPLKQDGNETNNSTANATFDGSLNECDDNGISAAALLSGSTDADWFRATFTEATITCVVDPSISLDSKGQTTRLCVYTRCSSSQNSGQSMACQDGSSADNSTVAGYYGCCKSGINPSFRFDSDCEQCNGPFGACSGDDDSASVYFRVDNLSAAQVCSTTRSICTFSREGGDPCAAHCSDGRARTAWGERPRQSLGARPNH